MYVIDKIDKTAWDEVVTAKLAVSGGRASGDWSRAKTMETRGWSRLNVGGAIYIDSPQESSAKLIPNSGIFCF
jgi:hypothetical protein